MSYCTQTDLSIVNHGLNRIKIRYSVCKILITLQVFCFESSTVYTFREIEIVILGVFGFEAIYCSWCYHRQFFSVQR